MGTGTTERVGLHHPVAVLAIVAAAYFVTGRLGLLLAIPPGYATAVWPPSGIALAGVLLYGSRVWPGILLGSLLVNVGTSFDATSTTAIVKSVTLAASIGLGAALQAVGSAFLVRRFVGFPTPLYEARAVATFMALGGPLGCLINATWSVTTLLVAGLISWASYPFSWWTWWVGDTIGVLTITPLVLIVAAEPRSVWRRRRLPVALPLGITFALVVALFVFTSNREVAYLAGQRSWYTWAVLATGLLFTGLLGALLLIVTGHTARIEPLVAERTAELQQANATMAREIAERKHAEETLASSEARQRALLHAIPDLMFRIRRDGTFLDYKAERASDLALPPEAFLGRTIAEVWPELASEAMAHVERALQTGQTEVFEYRLTVNGRPRDFEARIVASGTDEVVAICRDVTARLAADRAKAAFLLVVSHELRTPLTSIRGALGLLTDGTMGAVPKDGQEMLGIAVASADRLARIVNDVLELERIRLDRFRMSKEVCDAWALVVLATDAMRGLAAHAEVTLAPHGQRLPVWADSHRIVQVLTNLLSNAIKFSPRGATIWLSVERQDGQALFRVRDQGRGIPPDRLERIFERFEQVYDSDLRRQGGLGLGLFICRTIVEHHGGRIWTESTLGAGSTFLFSLPLPQEKPDQLTRHARLAQSAGVDGSADL